MSRTVLTAGLLSVAALGLGIVSAQAAPSPAALSGITGNSPVATENVHWRRHHDWRRYNYWRWNRFNHHRRHHHWRRWW